MIQDVLYHGLPGEYGENELSVMAVDPNYIFASWEVTEDEVSRNEGDLVIRMYDVTGIRFNGSNANSYFDIRINNRVGSGFFETTMHGKNVIMEIGFIGGGKRFRAIKRSNCVSVPRIMLTFDEIGIAKRLYESGVPVGYLSHGQAA